MPEDPASSGWHVDRRIPVALIITLVLQAVGAGVAFGQLFNRVATLEARIESIAPNADRLTRLEVQGEQIRRSVERIETILDRREQ